MSKWDLEQKRERLRQKLIELTEVVEYSNDEVKNLDVYTHHYKKTRGSDKEIDSLREQIKELDEQIRQAEINEEKSREEARKYAEEKKQKEKQEREEEVRKRKEEIEQEKKDRKLYYKLVKQRYKEGPLADRILDKIIPFRGGKPKWGKIKKYSAKELEFLKELAKGKTRVQDAEYADWERRYDRKHYTHDEISEMRKSQFWHDFTSALGSKYTLEQKMQREEQLKKEQSKYRRY